MTHYPNLILPTSISLGTSTGPRTNVKRLYTSAGNRKANKLWSQKLRKLNLRYGVRTVDALYTVLEIYEAMDGPGDTFLARDWNDWNTSLGDMGPGDEDNTFSAIQRLRNNTTLGYGLGDGTTTNFTFSKRYAPPNGGSVDRLIWGVDEDTVVVEVNGVPQGSGDFTVIQTASDTSLEFSVAPPNGHTVFWGGKFYIVAAFESEDFIQQLDNVGINGKSITSVPSIPVEEIRNPF